MFEELVARKSNKETRAKEKLEASISSARPEQQLIVAKIATMVIKDSLVLPRVMTFYWQETQGRAARVCVNIQGNNFTMNNHALSQFAGYMDYTKTYLNRLHQGNAANIEKSLCRSKLAQDLNWHACNSSLKDRKKNDAKFLVRSVDGEIRGFLSRSFKRHLASAPLLRAFLRSCDDMGLEPVSSAASPVRVQISCVLPHVFEPVDGEFLAVGVSWSNSDFGGGRMKVSMFVKRIWGGSEIVLNDSISEVHIGPVIEEADVEMSSETNKNELAAQKSAINDAVRAQMTEAHIQKLLDVVRVASEEKVPWHKLKADMAKLLNRTEMEQIKKILAGEADDGVEDLPPVEFDEDDDPLANRWWASAVVGKMAAKEEGAERKKSLQELAGQILGKAA